MIPAKILLIDDDDLFRKAVRLTLEQAGYAVVEAREGGEGLRLYREQRPDLVLTDLIMPGKEGLETIREMKAIDPTVKIIAMSGGGRVDARDYLPLAKAFGATRIMDKPFSDTDLKAAIRAVLGTSQTP